MHNDKYSLEYYEIIKKDEKGYYEDYQKLQEAIKNSSAYYKGEPIPVTYQGFFYDKKAREDFQYMADMLMSITRKITKEYVDNPDYRKHFNFDKKLEDLIIHDPGYDIPVPICRYDVFYTNREEFKFVEFNTDGASAMNEDNTIGKLMLETKAMKEMGQKYNLTNVDLINRWARDSVDLYEKSTGKKNPNVAIVDVLEIGTSNEFEEFKKAYENLGLTCEIVDIRNLKYIDGKLMAGETPIDLVYRRIVTVEFMKLYDELEDFRKAYFDNAFFMVGSFRSQIMHYKLTYKIFRLEDTRAILSQEENDFLERHIPYTEKFVSQEDLEVVKKNKDDYIFKPLDAYASHGIYTGRDHSPEEFEKIVEEILGTGYIYQEYYDQNMLKVVEFDEEGRAHLNEFGAVVGMFIYNEQFVAPYTRIGQENLISGARKYYTTPSIYIEEK